MEKLSGIPITCKVATKPLSQLRPKGLHPVEHRASRDINMSLSQELHDMGSRHRIAGIPTNRSQDHVRRPAIAGEGGGGVSREITVAGPAAVPLSAPLIIAVSFRGWPFAIWAMHHEYREYHEHQLISQTLLREL